MKADGQFDDTEKRQAVMALCAEARGAELASALDRLAPVPPSRDLRPPETGLVMLRGRAGGDGAAFNVGEATVTRAAVVVGVAGENERIGFAYHLGRDVAKARQAAILDALWQAREHRGGVEAALEPVRLRIETERSRADRQIAATRVNFFTLARGED
jgi:alpha-D-ribose 1-methylphosphonate 5-triphosphate synthase subunit PhnG